MEIYVYKCVEDRELAAQNLPRLNLGEYLYKYYEKTLGSRFEILIFFR